MGIVGARVSSSDWTISFMQLSGYIILVSKLQWWRIQIWF